jgi:DNA-binding SARP family transcriptional activator/tetratricopeptide (TPR) repeat protein/TolB-like protein
VRLRTFGGLWIEDDAGQVAGVRPQSLAILAIVASAAKSRRVSRDCVLGILWPESTQERARHALSQALYSLRRELGADAVVSGPTLTIDARVISSDVDAFEQAVAAKHWADAASLYSGPFLDGFYLADAPDFEQWVDGRRATLARDGARAIESFAKELAETGRLDHAAEQWRRLASADPLNARYATAYMEARVVIGDRVGAVCHGRAHAARVKEELDVEPDASVIRLLLRLRQAGDAPAPTVLRKTIDAPSAPTPRAMPITPQHQEHAAAAWTPKVRRITRGGWGVVASLSVAAFVAVALPMMWRETMVGQRIPIIAVGQIRDLSSSDTASSRGAVLSDLLSISLGRIRALQVIARSRMLELMPRDADSSRAEMTNAARQAGATEVIDGELIATTDHRFEFEVQRVEISSGIVRRVYRVTGDDRFALVDSVTELIASDLHVDLPEGSVKDVSTRSPVALGLYDEGLRSFYRFDFPEALQLFRSSLIADSTFAMAAYYAWRASHWSPRSTQLPLRALALRLAPHASERDRLLIRAHVAANDNDPMAQTAAESLAARYPNDPEGLARAAEVSRDLARVVALLERAIAIDSASGTKPGAICRLCDELYTLEQKYDWADSLAAADRTLDRWMRLRPDEFEPWALRGDLLSRRGRSVEAFAALDRAGALGMSGHDSQEWAIAWRLHADELDALDSNCTAALSSGHPDSFAKYRWDCTIGLRAQGRFREAFALHREGRVPGTTLIRGGGAPPDTFQTAIMNLEMGHPLVAADDFVAIGRALRAQPSTEGMRARNGAWFLTLSATAAVAGGDTLRARLLVDSIDVLGRGSSFGRDPLLHHFVRGLLLVAEHRDAAAVEELKKSIFSPTHGYTRANYELGSALLRLGRPADGIPIVRAALHGGIEGSALYITHTEFHELLAKLFDASGQRDSAAVHYAAVERAWRSADDILKPRYDSARTWLVRTGYLR